MKTGVIRMLINRILGRSLIILLVAGMGFAHSQTLSGKITERRDHVLIKRRSLFPLAATTFFSR